MTSHFLWSCRRPPALLSRSTEQYPQKRDMTYYGNELTLSLVLLSTTGTPFATVNAPWVRAQTVAVANDGLSAGANAASRALLLKNMLLTMIAVVYLLCSVPTEFY